MSAPLDVGGEAWALVQTKPTPSGRRIVLGAARVRVESIAPVHHVVRVLLGSGVPVDHRLEMPRHDLYACVNPGEHAAFGVVVTRIWPPLPRRLPREPEAA